MDINVAWEKNEYIFFVWMPTKLKTKVFEVRSKRSGSLLGVIKFYGAWRCYVFYPEAQTIFNAGCLKNIMDFSQLHTDQWRNGLKARNNPA